MHLVVLSHGSLAENGKETIQINIEYRSPSLLPRETNMTRRSKRPSMFENNKKAKKRNKRKEKAPENVPHFTNESSVMKHMLLQYTSFFSNHNSSPCSSKSYNPTSESPRGPPTSCRPAAVLQLMRVNSQTLLEWLALRHNLKTQQCACCDWWTEKKKKL